MPTPILHGLYLGMNAKPWQTVEQESATPKYPLNAFFDDELGNRFRYALNGAGALVAGNIVQGAALAGATTTLQSACAINTAAAAGSKRFLVTAATTGQSASLYAEGLAAFWDNDLAAVYTRIIKDNGALTTTGSGDTGSYIDVYEALPVALTTSDKVSLSVNPFKNIVVAPTTITGKVLGGVRCAVTAAYYCWVQTRGWFAFRIKDASTNVQAGPLAPAGTTAGSLINAAEADTAAVYKTVVGISNALWLDEYGGLIYLSCE